MNNDNITRLAERLDSVLESGGEVQLRQAIAEAAAELRTLAQQGKAGGVEEVGYVNQDGSVTWLTDGPYSQYSLKPKPGAKIYTAAPQPKDAT